MLYIASGVLRLFQVNLNHRNVSRCYAAYSRRLRKRARPKNRQLLPGLRPQMCNGIIIQLRRNPFVLQRPETRHKPLLFRQIALIFGIDNHRIHRAIGTGSFSVTDWAGSRKVFEAGSEDYLSHTNAAGSISLMPYQNKLRGFRKMGIDLSAIRCCILQL